MGNCCSDESEKKGPAYRKGIKQFNDERKEMLRNDLMVEQWVPYFRYSKLKKKYEYVRLGNKSKAGIYTSYLFK